jgi:hypothetical protein
MKANVNAELWHSDTIESLNTTYLIIDLNAFNEV